MSHDQGRQVVEASIEAYNNHDLPACLACFAPDATWEIIGVNRRFPMQDVTLVMEQFFSRNTRVIVRGIAASESLVAVEYLETFDDEWTNQPTTRSLAIFYEVKRGKIRRARQYAHADWVAPSATTDNPAS